METSIRLHIAPDAAESPGFPDPSHRTWRGAIRPHRPLRLLRALLPGFILSAFPAGVAAQDPGETELRDIHWEIGDQATPYLGAERMAEPPRFLLGAYHERPDGAPYFLATFEDPDGIAPPLLPGDTVQIAWRTWADESGRLETTTSAARVRSVYRVEPGGYMTWGVVVGPGWVHVLEVEGTEGMRYLRDFAVVSSDHLDLLPEPDLGVPQAVADALRAVQDSILQMRRVEYREPGLPPGAPGRYEPLFESIASWIASITPDENGRVQGVQPLLGPAGPVWVSRFSALNNPDDKASGGTEFLRVMDAEGRMLLEEEGLMGQNLGAVRLSPEGAESLLFGWTLLWHDGSQWRLSPPQQTPFVS